MTQWVVEHLGPDVPMHFTAFHPDYKMLDVPPHAARHAHSGRARSRSTTASTTPTRATCTTVRRQHVLPPCGTRVIQRDWYVLGEYQLDATGRCQTCGSTVPGVFDGPPGKWGARRQPVVLHPRRSEGASS